MCPVHHHRPDPVPVGMATRPFCDTGTMTPKDIPCAEQLSDESSVSTLFD
ncbi:MAG: hypothetical protein ACI9TB_001701 [Parasphingorhabdus sp.]